MAEARDRDRKQIGHICWPCALIGTRDSPISGLGNRGGILLRTQKHCRVDGKLQVVVGGLISALGIWQYRDPGFISQRQEPGFIALIKLSIV